MRNSAERVASAHENLTLLEDVRKFVVELSQYEDILGDLIRAGEKRRLGRTSDIGLKDIVVKFPLVSAQAQGKDKYDVRIRLSPRAHSCTCPDWQQNGRRVGPCKHVLALGEYLLYKRVIPITNSIESKLWSILDHSEI